MDKIEIAAIKELKKYYRLKHKGIPNILNKLIYLTNELEGIKAMEFDDMPKGKGHKLDNRKEKMLDEKIELEKRLETIRSFVNYMEEALKNLDNIDKNLLIECYSKDKNARLTDVAISNKLSMSPSTLYRRKKEVLKKFSRELFGI